MGETTPSNNSAWDQKLLRWSAVATILGLAVAIYFGVKSKEKKSVEITYLAKLSLGTSTLGYGEKLKVQYENQSVNNLTKLAVKIANVGQVAIEKRDIETPITFPIKDVKILDANLVEKFPANMQVEIHNISNGVQVIHGLLNSGDYIRFEILCEGNPKWPVPEFRITGVPNPVVNILDSKQKTTKISFFDFPKPVEYFLVSISSLLPFLLAFGGFVAFFQAFGGVFKTHVGVDKKIEEALLLGPILDDCWKKLDIEKPTLQKGATDHDAFRWFDDPQELAAMISSPSGLEKDNRDHAKKIVGKLRGCVKDIIAQRLHKHLPAGANRTVRKKVRNEQYDPAIGLSEFLKKVRHITNEVVHPKGVFQRLVFIDRDSLLGGMILLIIGLSGCFVLAGTWWNLLAK